MLVKNFFKFKWVTKADNHLNREIIVNAEKLETRVAVLENGRLEEFQVEHPTEERLIGSIFKGRIQNLENDLQAAFVNIGMRKNAFLHYWDMNPDDDSLLDDEDEDARADAPGAGGHRKPRNKRFTNEEIAKRFPAGSVVTVQVSKGPIGTKGPRITASLSIPGRYLVLMPGGTLRGVSRKIGDAADKAHQAADAARTGPAAASPLASRLASARERPPGGTTPRPERSSPPDKAACSRSKPCTEAR